MNAEIITIGDEILIGQIVDTNSVWIASELNSIGINVLQITSISDNPLHLEEALDNASKRAELVLMTGGLGPTKDDRTKNVLVSYFSSRLIIHEPTLNHIKSFFSRHGQEITQLNADQALVPECCTVLSNTVGTAPGMWFEKGGILFISMPGVPFEMKKLMKDEIIPRLVKLNKGKAIIHHTIQTVGIPESFLAKRLEGWESSLPEYIHLAYLPSPGIVKLRLSAFGTDQQILESEVQNQVNKLEKIIPDSIFGYGEVTLAEVVGTLLLKKNSTVAVAESCTGGLISHEITSIPGSSKWYKGSVVAYSNEIKERVLHVEASVLTEHGAVCEPVVLQMANGVRKIMDTEYGIATSGIAGPDGGSPEKPVGTVWIAVSGPDGNKSAVFNFANNRERNIIRSSQTALDMLRLMLKE
jgi:nicotinamide-nucleotide amidase